MDGIFIGTGGGSVGLCKTGLVFCSREVKMDAIDVFCVFVLFLSVKWRTLVIELGCF